MLATQDIPGTMIHFGVHLIIVHGVHMEHHTTITHTTVITAIQVITIQNQYTDHLDLSLT